MPKVERCFLKVKKVLKEKQLIDTLHYEMNQIYETIKLKNIPIKPYLEEDNLKCEICENTVYKDFHFCPFCSQRLK